MPEKTREELLAEIHRLEAQLAEWDRAAGTLRETEGMYRRLVELLSDAVAIVGPDERIRYVNSSGVQLLGASAAEQVLGRSIWAFIHPEDEAMLKERQRLLEAGEALGYAEQKLVGLDGVGRPVEAALAPIVYQRRSSVLITARNLSPRKRIERMLSETQELFYNAFHMGPAALAVNRVADGRFVDLNEQFVQLSGYTREELITTSSRDLNIWADESVRLAVVQEIRDKGVVRDLEARLRHKDGSLRTVLFSSRRIEVSGEPCMLSSAIDISRRKEAQVAERESRALLYKIFHASPAPISITRLADGRFINVNDEWCHLTGYEREEVLGRTSVEHDVWADPTRRTQLVERLHREEVVHDFEFEVRTRPGEVRELLGSFQRILANGEECILAVLTDITARKQAEGALRSAKERAEEIARFRSGILTNVTHEVRTPLTVILGFTSMLRQGVDRERQRFVDLIERSGQRLLLTLDSVLDLAQLEAGTLTVDRRPHNVLDLTRAITDTLRARILQKGLTLELDLPNEPLHAVTDYEVLTRVLTHLLDNAIKFTEKGTISISVYAEDEQVCLAIRDTGIGIGETFLPRVFDPFSQESTGLTRTHQGSGLGLAVAKQLVERVGGTMRASSTKGEGSTFTIVLPGAEESVPVQEKEA